MAAYSVSVEGVRGVLLEVAAQGQFLVDEGRQLAATAESVRGSFGTAEDVAAAFAGFWSQRDQVADQLSGTMYASAAAVGEAAAAFAAGDEEMAATAGNALHTATAATPGPVQAGLLRFL
ncbi:DUF6507 family protein [Arthrobacter mangrovi]|uniref:PE domain-containing protein n=1 Tax=Arthrobacter mangrovi TaxID=2966350 RepID=A0ABQ5MZF2_9MICC|nr:DUF6507 family protein [Arthrobacter mangrovi]GLB69323.1 hypothetical protein AHIS1636_37660 [Arthrobacter mangrovi]